MPDFNDLLTEAHRVLDEARMVNDDAKRNGIDFVNTELDLGMTFAESALTSFSARHLDKAKQSTGCEDCLSSCPKIPTPTRSPREGAGRDCREVGEIDSRD